MAFKKINQGSSLGKNILDFRKSYLKMTKQWSRQWFKIHNNPRTSMLTPRVKTSRFLQRSSQTNKKVKTLTLSSTWSFVALLFKILTAQSLTKQQFTKNRLKDSGSEIGTTWFILSISWFVDSKQACLMTKMGLSNK